MEPKNLIVGFGTLLDTASVGATLSDAGQKKYTPVVVHGFRRLFNLRPEHYESSFVLNQDGIEAAAANIEPVSAGQLLATGEPPHFNGVAFAVDDRELESLDLRERYYKRIDVELIDFFTGKPMGPGVAYASDLDARWIERDPSRLLPRWRDIALARRGAYAYGTDFGSMFDQTTFLADGQTLLVERYREHLDRTLVPGEVA